MRNKLSQIGLIIAGIVIGVAISLNFSAVAQREILGPLPVEELRAFTEVFGRIKSDYRISQEITYNNFPLPACPEQIIKKIEEEMPRIYLEYLPPYSPDYNLIELVWHSAKEYIAHRLFKSIEELLREIMGKTNEYIEILNNVVSNLYPGSLEVTRHEVNNYFKELPNHFYYLMRLDIFLGIIIKGNEIIPERPNLLEKYDWRYGQSYIEARIYEDTNILKLVTEIKKTLKKIGDFFTGVGSSFLNMLIKQNGTLIMLL